MSKRKITIALAVITTLVLIAACQAISTSSTATSAGAEGSGPSDKLIVYSGRSENLVGPLIAQFAESSGIDVEVRYGGTSEMAATILEEGRNSPADVFFGQDAGALGALDAEGRLSPLPESLLNKVDPHFRSAQGDWVGTSGRARVLIYNTDAVDPSELPASVEELVDPKWQGRVAWAPTNGSFQSFVTAMRLLDGEDATRDWLTAMIANDVQSLDSNDAIVAAVGAGEVDLGLVNHYYLYQFLDEQGEDFAARNYFFPEPGAGSIVNVAGVGILDTAQHRDTAETFVEYLLSTEAQQYFAEETREYPLADDVPVDPSLKPLAEIAAPDLDLSNLKDLQGTLQLLQETGTAQ